MSQTPEPIRTCLVIGHSGFLGRHFCARLRLSHPAITLRGLSHEELDLMAPQSVDILSDAMDEGTCVVMMAAVKRQLGDDPDVYQANILMTVNLAKAIRQQPPGRLIYLSSAAVYGEDIGNMAITETTVPTPRSYYGLAKLAAEGLLDRAFGEPAATRLVLVRPTTIYGGDEPDSAYGPAGFTKRAKAGETIPLWGDGSELRDFVHVPDAANILCRLVNDDFAGTLNLVSGVGVSFRDILHAIEKHLGRPAALTEKTRSKDKVDQAYDNGLLRRLMPDVRFDSIDDALEVMLRDLRT